MTSPSSVLPRPDTTAIAVLSWSLAAASVEIAAAAVEPARDVVPPRWLAAHPADASLAAHLAGHLACRY
jgi:hypothetical protein